MPKKKDKPKNEQKENEFISLKENSFGFLRFFFAMMVLYTHTFPIGGFGEEPIEHFLHGQESIGSLAVIGFFIISGFLVTHSLLVSKSYIQYFLKRALRIFPGFWICLIVTAFIFAPFAYYHEHHTLSGFFLHPGSFSPVHYVSSNAFLLIHQYRIDTLFSHHPLPYIFNGSLWTLFFEAKAYVLIAILGLVGGTKNRTWLLGIVFVVLFLLLLLNPPMSTPNKFIRLLWDKDFLFYTTYFMAGAILFLYRKYLPRTPYFYAGLVILSLGAILFNLFHQILPFTAPFIVLWLAEKLPLQGFTKYGDFSYGIYIYAFPVQQLLVMFHFNTNFFLYLLSSIFFTIILAVLSWYLIESRALKLKKRIGTIFIRRESL